MNHLTTEQLERYGKNCCSPEEMILVIQHLDICLACFSSFQVMYPKQTDPKNFVEIPDLSGDAEAFHLDYEAHLQPFVDNELDEVDCEIVQTHLQVCSRCALELRSLREFSESLQLQELHQKQTAPAFFPALNWAKPLQLSAVGIVCVVFGLSIFLIFSSYKAPMPKTISELLITAQSSKTEIPGELPPSSDISLSPNKTENKQVLSTTTEKNDLVNGRKSNNPAQSQNISKKESSGIKQLTLLESESINLLPQNWQNEIAQALRSKTLSIPDAVKRWNKNSNQRSISEGETFVLSPNKEVIKEQTPTFIWTDLSQKNKTYTVQIFDENFTLITESPKLNQSEWKPNIILPRGKIYRWQINGIRIGSDSEISKTKVANGNFVVLSIDQKKELEQIENLLPEQYCIRGILYAEKGLLKDSQNEFRKCLKQNPNSEIIKDFFRQVK